MWYQEQNLPCQPSFRIAKTFLIFLQHKAKVWLKLLETTTPSYDDNRFAAERDLVLGMWILFC